MSWHKWMLGSVCHCCDCVGVPYTMIGERHTRLCDDCANKFHAWITGHGSFKHHRLLKAERAYLYGLCVAGQQVSRADWETHCADMAASHDVLFRVTGLWLEEHKAPVATEQNQPDTEPARPAMNYGSLTPSERKKT